MKKTAIPGLAVYLSIAAACGGGEAPAPQQNPVQNQPVATQTSTTDAGPAGEGFAGLPPPYNTAEFARGKRTWRLCQSCHLMTEGSGHLVGPNLHGMFGRPVASAPGFEYSPALGAEDFVWTPERVDDWLANPRTFVPGNRMSFAGVRREDDRLAVIAYMMLQSGYQAEATADAEAP